MMGTKGLILILSIYLIYTVNGAQSQGTSSDGSTNDDTMDGNNTNETLTSNTGGTVQDGETENSPISSDDAIVKNNDKPKKSSSNVVKVTNNKVKKNSRNNMKVKRKNVKKNSATSSNDVIVTNEDNNVTSKCPTFNTRYEKNDLIVEIEPNVCEIVASIKATRMPLMKTNRGQRRRNKKSRKNNIKFRPYYHPVVSYRTVNTTTETNNTTTADINNNNNMTSCPQYKIKPLGPYVVVETVPGECQIVIGVVREKSNLLSRLRGNRKRTQLAIEYIDELLL